MRKRRSFQPTLSDRLEDRVVPSTTTGFQPQTFNYAQVANQINQAFNTFRTDFNNQLATFLNSGTSTALTQLRTFDTQRVGQLAQELQSALAQVPGGTNGLAPFIANGVNGQFTGSLLAMLDGIPGNTGTGGGPSGLFGGIANAAINASQLAANNLLSVFAWGLGSGQSSFGTASPVSGANFNQLVGSLNNSFGSFRTSFGSQLGGFTGGTVSSSQFQSSTALEGANLVQGLQGAFNGGTGMSSGLAPFVGGQVNGAFAGAMMSGLSGIPNNTGTNGGPDSLFSLASTNMLDATQLAANNMASAFTWGFNQGMGFADAFARGGAGGTATASAAGSTTTGNTTVGTTSTGGTASFTTMTGHTTSRGTTYTAGNPGTNFTGNTGGTANGGTTGRNTGGTTGTNTGTSTGGTTTTGTTGGGSTTGGTTTGTSTGSTNNPGNNGNSTGGFSNTGGTTTGTTTGGTSTGSTNNPGNNGVSTGGFPTNGGTTTGGTTTTGGSTTGGTLPGTSTGSTNNPGNNGVSSGGFSDNAGSTNMGNSGFYNPGPTNGMYTGPTSTGNRFPTL